MQAQRAKAPRDARDIPTRDRLLDAALAVFERYGWSGYTVHAVVAESRVSLGSLYHHFGSMDGLTAALYMRCMAALLDGIGASLEGSSSESRRTRPRADLPKEDAAKEKARGVIVAIVRAYLAYTEKERVAAAFIHTSPSSTALTAHAVAIAADKAPRIERIADAIRVHVRAGTIVDLPEPLLEMLIIGPVAEVARRWLAGVPSIDLDEAARLLPERVWRSVRA
jgi:AcrR family transcriptional regulator